MITKNATSCLILTTFLFSAHAEPNALHNKFIVELNPEEISSSDFNKIDSINSLKSTKDSVSTYQSIPLSNPSLSSEKTLTANSLSSPFASKSDFRQSKDYQILSGYMAQSEDFLFETKVKIDFVIQAAMLATRIYSLQEPGYENDSAFIKRPAAIRTIMTAASKLLPISEKEELAVLTLTDPWHWNEWDEKEKLYSSALFNIYDFKELSLKAGMPDGEHLCMTILPTIEDSDKTENKVVISEQSKKLLFNNWCEKESSDPNSLIAKRQLLIEQYPEYYDWLLLPMLKAGKTFDDLLNMVKNDHKIVINALEKAQRTPDTAKDIVQEALSSVFVKIRAMKIFNKNSVKKLKEIYQAYPQLMSKQERLVVSAITYDQLLFRLLKDISEGKLTLNEACELMKNQIPSAEICTEFVSIL